MESPLERVSSPSAGEYLVGVDGSPASAAAARWAADRAARDGVALVLGARPQHSRPHARFIGSTATRCLRGAECPVVMVPDAPAAPAATSAAYPGSDRAAR